MVHIQQIMYKHRWLCTVCYLGIVPFYLVTGACPGQGLSDFFLFDFGGFCKKLPGRTEGLVDEAFINASICVACRAVCSCAVKHTSGFPRILPYLHQAAVLRGVYRNVTQQVSNPQEKDESGFRVGMAMFLLPAHPLCQVPEYQG